MTDRITFQAAGTDVQARRDLDLASIVFVNAEGPGVEITISWAVFDALYKQISRAIDGS